MKIQVHRIHLYNRIHEIETMNHDYTYYYSFVDHHRYRMIGGITYNGFYEDIPEFTIQEYPTRTTLFFIDYLAHPYFTELLEYVINNHIKLHLCTYDLLYAYIEVLVSKLYLQVGEMGDALQLIIETLFESANDEVFEYLVHSDYSKIVDHYHIVRLETCSGILLTFLKRLVNRKIDNLTLDYDHMYYIYCCGKSIQSHHYYEINEAIEEELKSYFLYYNKRYYRNFSFTSSNQNQVSNHLMKLLSEVFTFLNSQSYNALRLFKKERNIHAYRNMKYIYELIHDNELIVPISNIIYPDAYNKLKMIIEGNE